MTRSVQEWLLDEKVILSALAMFFAIMGTILIAYKVEKEYVVTVFGFVSMSLGALLRGIPGHQVGGVAGPEGSSTTTTRTTTKE